MRFGLAKTVPMISLNCVRAAPLRADTEREATMGEIGGKPHQKFTYSHLEDDSFEEGLRAYAKYRDLGMVEATSGMVRAHVIKLLPPFDAEEVSKRHKHDVQFQLCEYDKYCRVGDGGHVHPYRPHFSMQIPDLPARPHPHHALLRVI